ncbi:uncharacterized protein BO72DRAFT_527298 [Aspergillus fijiensis CBS 313.89]|uniref:Uncharacterized protein n=1 Tax=Aspergillus fijiensis CBS 313.89 TaxID=1448319 RepID=A0A8G1RW05_9EURO|nr:uncharacterized protein BO72DRAFT_527298 [Aspergillus fijiensis CBS 313.89]RAK77811.1 hypothetical protein BO72DRAFT_527298 [Aspergillus fijiensis CBS 313.89]
MSHYTIDVENQRGANTAYAVMMDTPDFSGDHKPWLNVWYTAFVPFRGSFSVETGEDFYAWVGTVPTSPGPGVIVINGMSLLARLGSEGSPGSTFDMKIIQSFPTIQEIEPSATTGSYEVKTGTDFSMPNRTYLVGLAKVNNRGQVAPVGSVAPDNDQNIQVTPKMRFFTTESHQISGEIVDRSAVERYGAVVDFSSGEGAGKFYATATQNEDGRFTVKYFDSPE